MFTLIKNYDSRIYCEWTCAMCVRLVGFFACMWARAFIIEIIQFPLGHNVACNWNGQPGSLDRKSANQLCIVLLTHGSKRQIFKPFFDIRLGDAVRCGIR